MAQIFLIGGSGSEGTQITDIYVSSLNGNDNNDGLTPATAVQTDARAKGLVPSELTEPLIIHYAQGTYVWAQMPTPTQRNANARIWLIGDGAGQVGDDGFTVIGTDVCGAGTDANQIVTTALAPALNGYQSFTVEITSGPAANYRRTIINNTAGAGGALIMARRTEAQGDAATTVSTVIPVAGNSFRVVRPNVVFTGWDALSGQPSWLNDIGRGDSFAPLFLINLAFQSTESPSPYPNSAEVTSCTIYGAGVEWRGTRIPSFVDCNINFGCWDNVIWATTVNALLTNILLSQQKAAWFDDIGRGTALSNLAQWRGWGMSVPDVVAATTTANTRLVGGTHALVGVFPVITVAGAPGGGIAGHAWGGYVFNNSSCCISGRSPDTAIANQSSLRSISGSDSTFTNLCTGCTGPYSLNNATTAIITVVVNNSRSTLSRLVQTGTGGANAPVFASIIGGQASFVNGFTATTDSTTAGASQFSVSRGAQISLGSNVAYTCTSTGAASVLSAIENAFIADLGTPTTWTGAFALDRGAIYNKSNSMTITGAITIDSGAKLIGSAFGLTAGASTISITDGGELNVGENGVGQLASAGAITMARQAKFRLQSVNATNAISGNFDASDNCDIVLTGDAASQFTVGGSAVFQRGTRVVQDIPMTFSGGLNIQHGADYVQNKNMVSALAITPTNLSGNSRFTQVAGTLSSACSGTGNGFNVGTGSQAIFAGGANTTLTGLGGGQFGLSVTGGSKAWFNGTLVGVTGPVNGCTAGAAAQTNAATAALAANAFFTDAAGAGNVIGRAA